MERIPEIVEKLRGGEIKASELVEDCFEKIKELNPKINAFVTLNPNAVKEAKEAKDKPLAGLPVAVKDNTDTKGIRTTYGSKLLENNIPTEDAVIVERLKKAGAVVIGKTNIPEFGLIAYTDNVLFGPTRNPWDLTRTVGGSSGGSAAAVASGMVPVATGNDGGGSIRIPASFCSLYGLKPTTGRIPWYPSMPVFIGMVSEGFLTNFVEDTAFLLDYVKGQDIRDINSLPDDGKSYYKCLEEPVEPKIAFSPNLGYAIVDPEVEEIVRKSAFKLEKIGEVEEVKLNLPSLETELTLKVVLEFFSFISDRLEEWKKSAFPPYLGFLSLAESITFREYIKIEEKRMELWRALREIFEKYDFLITPTTAVKPFKLGKLGPEEIAGVPATPIGWMPFTYPFNFTGQPAASIPAGLSEEGLPIGMQIVGRKFDDLGVLKISKAFQDISPWQNVRPRL
ncbi:MAG: aspartyl-tRNA(Asn)/glutamyl-tRNA(Gln) amidotransferase subunit [Archaeoglobaceae archaeon]|nr:aspartyl-tRNA(Asn)/glutamyl-tRNA(Gln) amidotransferase subunit [Archaeoglobaceae archaeon]MDK2875914.1 aspartyl-tRNA(Asn)/glutamyl-tRNA(Gln) amidotransferase subunit [Archaeoglobaceae archaeon]